MGTVTIRQWQIDSIPVHSQKTQIKKPQTQVPITCNMEQMKNNILGKRSRVIKF